MATTLTEQELASEFGVPTIPEEITDEQVRQAWQQTDSTQPNNMVLTDDQLQAAFAPALTDDELSIEFTTEESPFKSFLLGGVSGATLQFADELAGGIESVLTDKTYKQARDAWRSRFKQARQVNPEAFLAGEIGGGVATAFTPIGWTGTGLKGAIAVGAAAGAVFEVGGSEAETSRQLAIDAIQGAALGGATAGVLGGIVKTAGRLFRGSPIKQTQYATIAAEAARAGQPIPKHAERHVAQLIEDNSEQIETITKQLLNKGDPIVDGIMQRLTPQGAAKNPTFAKWLIYADPSEPFTRTRFDQAAGIWRGYNNKKRNQLLQQFRESQARLRAGQQVANKNKYIKDPLQLGFVEYFRDPMFKAMDIDRVYGTNVEGFINGISAASNEVSNAAAPFLKRIEGLQAQNRKLFKGGESEKLMQWLDGQRVSLTPEQTTVAKEWRSWFDDIKDHLGKKGVKIEERANYFPHKIADKATVYRRLRQRYDQLAAKGTAAVVNDEQLMKSVTILGDGLEPTRSADVIKIIESIKSPKFAQGKIGRVASATFEREGVLPDIIREFDVERAAVNYLSSNLKAAYFDKPLRQLHSSMTVLRGLDAENSTKWLDHYLRRMSGEPSNAHALLDSMATKWKIHWRDVARDPTNAAWTRSMGKAAAMAPDFLSWSTAQIYPNLLGWNPYAPLRNMSQTWLVTAPELGGGYGQKLTARGWRRALTEQARGTKPEAFLQSRNLIGDQFTGESARKAVEEGIGRVPGVQMIDKMSKFGLSLYSKSDSQNRWFTWHIGQELAHDVFAKVPKAVKFVNQLPAGTKQQVKAALQANDQAAVGTLLSEWLIRKTQFNYGTAGLSQFGQDYGKLVSMFMKWGVMISSDMLDMVRHRKDMERITAPLMKYMAPLTLLMVGDGVLKEMGAADDPHVQLLIGKGLKNASPVNSVLSVGVPPLISTPLRILNATKTAMDGELGKAGEQVTKALYPFVPGVGALPKIEKTTKQLLRVEEE